MGTGRRVLVVGGGIAGLSLVRALQRRGIDTDVVERVATWSPSGAGIYLPANGIRALRQLGLGDQLISRGQVNTRRRYLTAEGKTSFEIDLADFWQETGPCLGVTRADLHDVLLSGVDGAPVRLGTTVDIVKQDASGVWVVFHDGSEEHYDLLVGADGIHSSIRTQLFGPEAVGRADLVSACWRFLTACPATVDCWTLLAGASAYFLVVPTGDDRAYCWAAFSARQRVAGQPAEAQFRSAFEGFAAPVPQVMRQIDYDQLHYSTIEEVRRPTFGRGRTVLIGDAAHAMPPTMAQGAALAFEDAIVLAELLAADPDWTDVAARLASRRRQRVEWVKEHTSRQSRMLNLPYALRKRAVRLAGETLWRRSFAPLREPV